MKQNVFSAQRNPPKPNLNLTQEMRRRMKRFYVQPGQINAGRIAITDSQAHHLKDVLRLKKQDRIAVFDGKGMEYTARIKRLSDKEIIADIVSSRFTLAKDAPYKVILAQAVSKNTKIDFVVQKATELGVDAIIPMATGRSIVKLNRRNASSRIKRWQRIAEEASRQCGRTTVPVIRDSLDVKYAIAATAGCELKLFFCIDKDTTDLRHILSFCGSSLPTDIAVFIGPEGDFTPAEIILAKDSGFKLASLGERVLRTETAGLYVLSVLDYVLTTTGQVPTRQ
jgi:16S rRNA (uracil1498-N3)-methyltransferase